MAEFTTSNPFIASVCDAAGEVCALVEKPKAREPRIVDEQDLSVGDEVIVSYRGIVTDEGGGKRVRIGPGAYVDLLGWPSEIKRL